MVAVRTLRISEKEATKFCSRHALSKSRHHDRAERSEDKS